ncbi:hypothetical protein SPIRO4BDMA_50630 [uncultured spirochete]|uniref:Uncharacterized protein n=1 Tax=uncultured spirochete TaxID=156406 RepID=A0A3P3XS54_9SPIR|nr:hypothetical protein SPIRO4BDMA_50630 [uncultured spirochete]
MKRLDKLKADIQSVSRPPRARGLKQSVHTAYDQMGAVAPPAGAWIETEAERRTAGVAQVAPPAGAWIETMKPSYSSWCF